MKPERKERDEFPSLFIEEPAGAEAKVPLTVMPPRDLLKREKLRTAQGIWELAKYRHPVCIPPLMRALESDDIPVRIAAGKALSGFGEMAFEALSQAALKGRGMRREQAVICLGDCGDTRATAVLLEVIQKERKKRFLFNTGAVILSIVVSLLVQWWVDLRNRDTTLRERAAESLGRLGDVRAVIPLARLAHSCFSNFPRTIVTTK